MRILIKGIVQGVGFRPYIYRLAHRYDLKGLIRNLGTGEVEIIIQGTDAAKELFCQAVYDEKPPLAVIDSLKKEEYTGEEYADFTIEKSEEKGERPSFIPPDVAICPNCLNEMREKGNRREDYYFTSCTDCGPRFTIIEDMPYDRPRTTMKEFPLCPECLEEYQDPLDRRYHAQPIACAKCGPAIDLYDKERNLLEGDPIKRAAELLDAGYVLVVKGIGGMHLVMDARNEKAVAEFRSRTKRKRKPYAIMARDEKVAEKIAFISDKEREALLSVKRPIVVLKKNDGYDLAKSVSYLHTIGIMLPYTGLHYLLFDYLKTDYLVMTSANLPGLPMTKDNEEAFFLPADYFLLHERDIYIQCDDSVVRFAGEDKLYLRRSRGEVPLPIELPKKSEQVFLSLGAEQNTAICLVREDKAVLSQYLGTLKNWETECYYRRTLDHFLKIFRMNKPEMVVCDLHPGYETTNLARELSDEHQSELVQVQHHLAHFASVLAENKLDRSLGLICDGTGYGYDGHIWGGEVFLYQDKEYTRLAHLEEHPLIGGDLAVKEPWRMALAILEKKLSNEELAELADELLMMRDIGLTCSDKSFPLKDSQVAEDNLLDSVDLQHIDSLLAEASVKNIENLIDDSILSKDTDDLSENNTGLKDGDIMIDKIRKSDLDKIKKDKAHLVLSEESVKRRKQERDLFLQQLKNKNYVLTSSTGRILDAISVLLGASSVMDYEGEPAMALESLAFRGKTDKEGIRLPIVEEENMLVLQTSDLLAWVYRERKKGTPVNELAYLAQKSLLLGYVELGCKIIAKTKQDSICISGGVLYNEYFHQGFKEEFTKRDIKVYYNKEAGCGDNGISLGQAWYALSIVP